MSLVSNCESEFIQEPINISDNESIEDDETQIYSDLKAKNNLILSQDDSTIIFKQLVKDIYEKSLSQISPKDKKTYLRRSRTLQIIQTPKEEFLKSYEKSSNKVSQNSALQNIEEDTVNETLPFQPYIQQPQINQNKFQIRRRSSFSVLNEKQENGINSMTNTSNNTNNIKKIKFIIQVQPATNSNGNQITTSDATDDTSNTHNLYNSKDRKQRLAKFDSQFDPLQEFNTQDLDIYRDFEIFELIGKGSYGNVYKAFNIKERTYYAFKEIKLSEGQERQVAKEITILKTLSEVPNNDNTIKLKAVKILEKDTDGFGEIDLADQKKRILIIMEMGLCNLDELKRCRKRLDMPWTQNELLYILYSITKALETARSIRICHRDIKEKNIVVSDQYKVADLGEATYIPQDGIKKSGFARGTKAYWAPELQKKFYDISIPYRPEKTDVYALGVVMTRIASLKDDFNGYESINQSYPFLAKLVQRMVCEEAEKRITYKDILSEIQNSKIKLEKADEKEFIEILQKESLGKEVTADIQYKIAKGYQKIMNYPKSIEFFKKCEQLFEYENRYTDVIQCNLYLGQNYALLGQDSQSEDCIKKVQDLIQREFLSGQKKKIDFDSQLKALDYKCKIASLYYRLGKFDQSLDFYEQTIKDYLAITDNAEDLRLGQLQYDKALIHLALGQFDEAMELLQQSLQTQLKELVYNHPMIATIYMQMAQIPLKQKDIQKATDLYTKAIALVENFYSDNVMKRIYYKRKEALFLCETNQNQKAFLTFKNILNLLQNAPQEDQSTLASCYEDFGNILLKLGDYSKALIYFKNCLELREKYYCDGHPEIIRILMELGKQYAKHDKFKSLEQYEKLIHHYQKIYGFDQYPNDRELLEKIGLLYFDTKKYEQALEYFEKAADINEINIDNSPAVRIRRRFTLTQNVIKEDFLIEKMRKIANFYIICKNFPKALEFFEKSLDFLKEKYGVTSLEVSNFLISISKNLYEIGQVLKSLQYKREALEIRKKASDNLKVDSYLENLWMVAKLSLIFGDVIISYKNFEEILNIFDEIDQIDRNETYFNRYTKIILDFVETLLTMSQYQQSKSLLQKALNIQQKQKNYNIQEGDPYFIRIYIKLGDTSYQEQDMNSAIEFYQKACQILDYPDLIKSIDRTLYLQLQIRRLKVYQFTPEKTLEDNLQLFEQITTYYQTKIQINVSNCDTVFEYYHLKLELHLKYGEFVKFEQTYDELNNYVVKYFTENNIYKLLMWELLIEKELIIGNTRLCKTHLESGFKLLGQFFQEKPCMLTVRYVELKSELFYLQDKINEAVIQNTRSIGLKRRIFQSDEQFLYLRNYQQYAKIYFKIFNFKEYKENMNIISNILHDELAKQINNLDYVNLLEIRELYQNSFIERAHAKILRLKEQFFQKYYGTSSPIYLEALFIECKLLIRQYKIKEAESVLEQILSIIDSYTKCQNHILEMQAQYYKYQIEFYKGNFKQVLENILILQKHLSAKELDNSIIMGHINVLLGDIFFMISNHRQSQLYYSKSSSIYVQALQQAVNPYKALIDTKLACLHKKFHQISLCKKMIEKASQYFDNKDPRGSETIERAIVTDLQIQFCIEEEQHGERVNSLIQKSLQNKKSLDQNHPEILETQLLQNTFELKFKNPRKLKECALKFAKSFEELNGCGNPHVENFKISCVDIYMYTGDYESAQEAIQSILSCFRLIKEDECHVNILYCYLKLSEIKSLQTDTLEESFDYLDKAEAILKDLELRDSYLEILIKIQRSKYQLIKENYRQSYELLKEVFPQVVQEYGEESVQTYTLNCQKAIIIEKVVGAEEAQEFIQRMSSWQSINNLPFHVKSYYIAILNEAIGTIYLGSADKKKAITYLRNANILLEKIFPSESHPLRNSIKNKIMLCGRSNYIINTNISSNSNLQQLQQGNIQTASSPLLPTNNSTSIGVSGNTQNQVMLKPINKFYQTNSQKTFYNSTQRTSSGSGVNQMDQTQTQQFASNLQAMQNANKFSVSMPAQNLNNIVRQLDRPIQTANSGIILPPIKDISKNSSKYSFKSEISESLTSLTTSIKSPAIIRTESKNSSIQNDKQNPSSSLRQQLASRMLSSRIQLYNQNGNLTSKNQLN